MRTGDQPLVVSREGEAVDGGGVLQRADAPLAGEQEDARLPVHRGGDHVGVVGEDGHAGHL